MRAEGSGESAADRFTLGMQDDTVSIMEEGADAAQEGASTEEIDEATTTRREEVAPETVVEEDDDTADDGDTTTPAAPEAPKTDDSTKTSGLSSIEEEILALQKQMKSDRDADKWLAIVQAGLAIMASDSPTLAGAIGEGGLDGLKAFRDANERYQEGVIDPINARAKLKGDRWVYSKPNDSKGGDRENGE